MNDKKIVIKRKATADAVKKYRQTEKYKGWREGYQQSERGKAVAKKASKRYQQSKKGKERIRRYHQSEKNKEYLKNWRESEKGKEYMKEYHAKYDKLEKTKERKSEQRKTEIGKITNAKTKPKRRGLGHIRLNEQLKGGAWHHIDTKHVVCVPEELHDHIYHNVWTGENMEKINATAFGYISEDMFDKFVSGKM